MKNGLPPPTRLRPDRPPPAGRREVSAQFTGVVEPGGAVMLGQREFLGDVRHGAADEPERDPVRPVEC